MAATSAPAQLAGQRVAGEQRRRGRARGDAGGTPSDAEDGVDHDGGGAATLGSPEERRRRCSAADSGELRGTDEPERKGEEGEDGEVLQLTLNTTEATGRRGDDCRRRKRRRRAAAVAEGSSNSGEEGAPRQLCFGEEDHGDEAVLAVRFDLSRAAGVDGSERRQN